MSEFTVKDSGERAQFESGMVRDVEEGKVDYSLIFDGPMLERWAAHLTKGSKKYAARNWMKATGDAELERFRRSALRHFIQWLRGETDEDHAAAVMFNLNGAEYVKDRIEALARESEKPKFEWPEPRTMLGNYLRWDFPNGCAIETVIDEPSRFLAYPLSDFAIRNDVGVITRFDSKEEAARALGFDV